MALTKINSSVIANNTIAVGNIADNSVDATKIASNSILTRHIDDDQITTDQIAANTIATANIADNAVDGTKIASNSILTRHIDDNQIGIDQINVSEGSNGQALTTNGSGTLSFASVGVSGISSSADATAITINSSEHVGIGTTSPNDRLHIKIGTNLNWQFGYPNSTTTSLAALNDAESAYVNGRIDTLTLNLNSQSGGDVMIGTTVAPVGAGLAVNSGISSSSINAIEIQQATDGANKAAAAFGVAIGNGGESTNAADLLISTASGGSMTERMRISSVGYVKLNHAASEYGLELKSAGTRAGLVLKKPGTDTIQGSLLMMSDETLRLGTQSVYNIHMYQNGAVTLPNQHAALIYNTSAHSQGAGAVQYTFPTAGYNVGSCYNTSNGKFTVSVAGKYLVTSQMALDASTTAMTYFSLGPRVNGTGTVYFGGWGWKSTTNTYAKCTSSVVLDLAVNDYIETYFECSATHQILQGPYYTSVSIHKLS